MSLKEDLIYFFSIVGTNLTQYRSFFVLESHPSRLPSASPLPFNRFPLILWISLR